MTAGGLQSPDDITGRHHVADTNRWVDWLVCRPQSAVIQDNDPEPGDLAGERDLPGASRVNDLIGVTGQVDSPVPRQPGFVGWVEGINRLGGRG
jgi:hypothetical protein